MNRRLAYTLLFLCLSSLFAKGQQVFNVMEGRVDQYYGKALLLNSVHDYLEAYHYIQWAEQEADAKLKEKGISANALGSGQLVSYCGMKRTRAEIAYKLGLYADMDAVSCELHTIIEQWSNNDIAVRDNILAYLYKTDASSFYLMEKYDSAQNCLNFAQDVSREWMEYEFDFFYALRDDFAQLYYKQGQYDKALAQIDTILMHRKFMPGAMLLGDEKIPEKRRELQSQRAICLARMGRFDEAMKEIEPIVQYFRKGNDKRAYAEALRKKAKILMLQYDSTGKYNPEAVTCYQQYLAISRDFIDNHFVQMSESQREQYWMAEQPFVTDCFRLEDKAPGLLYDVALYSKAVLLQMGRDFKEGMTVAEKKSALASIRVNWQQVREKMPTSGCAIEFIVYEKSGQNHIGALVLNKKASVPVFIDIATLEELESLEIGNGMTVEKAITSTEHEDKDVLYQCLRLPELIWNEQLVKAIGQSENIYFAPDGLFHQLAVEYLLPDIISTKNLYRLTSTRLLVEDRQRIRTNNMLLCGGVDYSVSQDSPFTSNNDEQAYAIMSAKGMALPYLNGSKAEIDSIESLRPNGDDLTLRADSATESILRSLMGKYHLVLISTHGYFAEAATMGTDIKPVSTDTQLSQSCLFLAGAETNMRNRKFDSSMPDGILSARELAAMDLSNVDLVSLSACQSGLGFVTSDGVFGLQRGLKTAGVKAVIASLWEVDDQATITLMTNLYKNLQDGKSLHEAFAAARITLEKTIVQKTYPRKGVADLIVTRQYNLPRFYNAFILIDGLE